MLYGKITGLRALEREDLKLLRDWRNNPTFRRNFREHRELNLTNQESWFNRTTSNPNDFMFLIESLDKHEPLGACGLLYTNWLIRSSDFSFYIGHDNLYIDQNYAFDAARTLIKYAFNDLNLNKIWMELYEFDTLKIDFFVQKFGFKVDGKLRQNAFTDGRYWDSHIISLLKEDYSEIVNK